MERKLLDAVNGPVPLQSPSAPGSCAGWEQGQGASGATAQAPLHSCGGNNPISVCIFALPASLGWPHCWCHLWFFSAADEASSGHNIYWVLPQLLGRLISAL